VMIIHVETWRFVLTTFMVLTSEGGANG